MSSKKALGTELLGGYGPTGTGAICEVCGNVSFLGEPPENGDTEVHLRVNLELSTRYLPKERYTIEELAAVMSRFATKFQTGVTW
jgi:hypothetical protein